MKHQKGDSVAQRSPVPGFLRQSLFGVLLLVLPALTVLTAFGIAPGTVPDPVDQVLVRDDIPLPDLADAAEATPPGFMSQETVLRGDTVAALLDRLGVHDDAAMRFLRSDRTGRLIFRQLVPGRMLQAQTDAEGGLLGLRYFSSPSKVLEVRRDGAGFISRQRTIADPPRLVYKSATIDSSLFAATDAAGIPDAIALQVARVFATDIDFHTDLRRGDRFSVVYEMIYDSGELVGPGRIVAAQFVNAGHAYQAVLFADEDGHDGYYSLDGSSRAKAFLRSPVEFTRISSRFGRRFHPIFRNWRAHTGVDFAAPKGTRVLAAADGVVVSAGRRGGYGNAIELRHGAGITTLYGHLNRFARGIRAGARVHQGEVIGYVGMTGWATGPHLHYEFRIAGVYQDPLRVALPKADPVPERLRARFRAVADRARSTIELVSSATPARFE